MHALIIEDEPLVAMSIEEGLRSCGYRSFAFATSLQQAIEEARSRCPQLISADVQLSPGCGIDAVAAICSDEPIPVIFVTGTAGDLDRRRPGSIIVHKPFTNEDIKCAVDAVLRGTQGPANESAPLDTEYYRKRAVDERLLASQSAGNEVASIHTDLADQYDALVNQPELRSSFRIKWSAPKFDLPGVSEPSAG